MTTNAVWYESPLRAMGSGVLEARLEQSLRYLERLGIRVPQTGRHRKALELLSAVDRAQGDLDPTDTDLLVRLQYAHRDAYELFLIAFAATLRHVLRAEAPMPLSAPAWHRKRSFICQTSVKIVCPSGHLLSTNLVQPGLQTYRHRFVRTGNDRRHQPHEVGRAEALAA
jgi:hypothetical protein